MTFEESDRTEVPLDNHKEIWRRIPFLKIIVSLLFFVLLFKIIDVKSLWRALCGVRIGLFFLSYGVMVFGEVFIALRLQVLMRPTVLWLPMRRLFRIGFIAYFYAIFLPGGIGQIAAKWYKVTENKIGRLHFLIVSIIEKSVFLLVTLICVGISLILLSDPETSHLRSLFFPFIMVFLAIEGLFYLFLLSPSLYRYIKQRFASLRARFTGRLAEFMGHLGQLDPFIGQWWPPLLAAFLTVGVQIFIVIRIGLLFYAVDVSMPWVRILLISSLIFFIQMIPISLGGLGVRESAFAYLFHLYGYGADIGVVVGLLFFGQIVLCAIIGGVLELTDRGNQSAIRARAPARCMDKT
jgi:glycosyltransferase 2 family protein